MKRNETNKFHCNLTILDEQSDKPIVYKLDGQRFSVPSTVKLLTNSKYRVTLGLKPVASSNLVEHITINNSRIESFQVAQSTTDVESKDDDFIQLEFEWKTHELEVTKSGKRSTIIISVRLSNNDHIECDLQAKVYKSKSPHLVWGIGLKALQFDAINKGFMNCSALAHKELDHNGNRQQITATESQEETVEEAKKKPLIRLFAAVNHEYHPVAGA